MKTYYAEMCKKDGSTPLGQCPMYQTDAEDRHGAWLLFCAEHPDMEIVSLGLKSEIEDYWKRWNLTPKPVST